jgi:carbon monoxide dehydrogenase subunit G
MNVKATATINRPPEQVFDTLIDVEHHTDWSSGPDEITDVSENPAQMGTTWRQHVSVMGRDLDSNMRVNVYEPGQKFGFVSDKPIPMQITFTLEPQAGGTRLTATADVEPGGLFKFAGPMLSRTAKGMLEKDVQSLKATLERA